MFQFVMFIGVIEIRLADSVPQNHWPGISASNPWQWKYPPRYDLYNPYHNPGGVSFDRYQQRQPYSPYTAHRPSFNPYQPPGVPYNWQFSNTPTQRPFPKYYSNAVQDNVIWSSQWTEWLPASSIRWDILHDRTFARKRLGHISPRRFGGNPTQDATNSYKELANQYLTDIFPSKDDVDITYALFSYLIILLHFNNFYLHNKMP